jgi:3-hydroxyisobutyrate dehydrogenase-like beta-hydroxyacid dehydrogenase
MEKIGVIGLGRMGSAIALRLSQQGNSVTGWTRSGRTLDGIAAADSLAALVADSDTLILSLLDDSAVAGVLDACLACDLTGKQIIETSTVVPTILKERIDAITAQGATAVDAPISGGPELVAAGTCGVFIGGDDAAASRAQSVIAGFSNRVFHVGPLGTGLVMKTINNSMIQVYFAGLQDMMPLAKRAGLSMETALRIVAGGPAGTPMIIDRLPRVLGEDDSVGFSTAAAYKDNDVFQRVARSFGLEAPSVAHAAKGFEAALEAGIGEQDVATTIPLAYRQA